MFNKKCPKAVLLNLSKPQVCCGIRRSGTFLGEKYQTNFGSEQTKLPAFC